MFLFASLNSTSGEMPVPDGPVEVIRMGKALAAIVVPEKPCDAVMLAAGELKYHVKKATGIELQEYLEPDVPKGKYASLIYLGNCKKTLDAGIDCLFLPRFAGIISVSEKNLFLAGNDEPGDAFKSGLGGSLTVSAGTLFAVYDLLENELGVRWLWPGELGELIPLRSDITLAPARRRVEPRLMHSSFWVVGLQSSGKGWGAPKNHKAFITAQSLWLYRQRFCSPVDLAYGHSFKDYWQRFGKTNPDFFNRLPDGTRRPLPKDLRGSRITMCVSNPALHRKIAEEYKTRYDPKAPPFAYGKGNILNVCENDAPGICACERCRSWDAPHPGFSGHPYWGQGIIPDMQNRFPHLGTADGSGADKESPSLSDRYAKFYMAVQKEAEKINPNVIVYGFAYANYTEPPVNTKLNDRIFISFVGWPYFPFTDGKLAEVRKNWDGWHAAGAKLILRPNSTHSGHNMPIFYAKKLGNEYIHAFNNGLIGVRYDSLTGQWATQGPTLYALGRLNVRPELAVTQILDEYYSAFGPAKQAVKDYFEYWEKISDSVTEEDFDRFCKPVGRVHFKNWLQVADKIFTPEVMAHATELLDKAMSAAGDDRIAEARVEYLKYGFENADFTLKTLRAQRVYQATGTKDALDKFKAAQDELMKFRNSVEDKNICDMGYLYFREKTGSKWHQEEVAK